MDYQPKAAALLGGAASRSEVDGRSPFTLIIAMADSVNKSSEVATILQEYLPCENWDCWPRCRL